MPKGKNCPNCGAVYEIDKNKCPYCGTSYYDMSAIDFEDGEPFYLKIKTKMNGKTIYVTQLVVPKFGGLTLNNECAYAYGRYNKRLCSCVTNQILTTDVTFETVPDKNGSLFQIET